MALGSQATQVETLATLTGLMHDIFVDGVKDAVRRKSASSMMFQDADPGNFPQFSGSATKFLVDYDYKTGAMATNGYIPDYVGLDGAEGTLNAIRRYERFALDNLIQILGSGPGAYEDLSERIFNQLWKAWECMEMRQSVGDSAGTVCECSSRTNSTTVVVKNGYGHTSTNPLLHLSEGSIIAWYDVSETQIGGAATISDIDYSTNTITVDSATTWETDVGNQIVADDTIFFATAPGTTTDYFVSERNLAPNGLGVIVDPDASYTTVHGIAEATWPRSKPFRESSVTFDHLEVREHWTRLGQKRGFGVSPATDVAITFPSVVSQLNRTLVAYQQQSNLGGMFKGGYALGNSEGDGPVASLQIGEMPIYEDGYFYHDVFMTICKENLHRVGAGGKADYETTDGSMWSRISDFDGNDGYVREFMNNVCTNRGANSAITGIVTDVTDADFAPVPNY